MGICEVAYLACSSLCYYLVTKKQILRPNQNEPGKKVKPGIGDNHPPKNKIIFSELIINIFEYSPIENNAKLIAEYSTLYPDTSSASASGQSNG